jgi:hypothetical protein
MPSLARVGVGAALLLAVAPLASAQEDDVQRQLDELRAQNEELASQLDDLETTMAESAVDPDYLFGLEGNYGSVSVSYQIFGDVGGTISNGDQASDQFSSFAQGSVDLVLNATIGERFRAFSETVVDISSKDGSTTIGQERLWGAWTFADLLYAKVGTEHSPISRWNQLYHHGHYLETTISRPTLVSFEGGSGILPMHRTGIELGGSHFFGGSKLEYFGTVSNGRGDSPTNKQRGSDSDDSKALDVGLAYSPEALAGLRVGAAYVLDHIPEDPDSIDPDRTRSMRERIALANAEFRSESLVLRSEFALIEHEGRASGTTFDSDSGYLQAELPIENWTPYTRFGYRNMGEGDPFYAPLGRDVDLWQQTLGVRYEPVENVALKMEVVLGQEDRNDGSEVDVVVWAFQLSWWL